MKKTLSAVTAVIVLIATFLCLSGCGRYSSHYHAVGFVHSNTPKSAFMNFYEFEGNIVFKLKTGSGETLKYSAKLENGETRVYYDSGNGKTPLFSLKSDEEFDSETGVLPAGTVYVIVETDGKCINGELTFDI